MDERETGSKGTDEESAGRPAAPQGDAAPNSTPQTDPTNPDHQEAAGINVAAERTAAEREDEPPETDAGHTPRPRGPAGGGPT